MLEVKDLSVAYGEVEALSGLSMTVSPGEFVAILGANGAGKTTLLRAITSLEQPKAGSVSYNGVDITRRPSHHLVSLGIATVPEGRQLFSHMSVRDNLVLGAFTHRRKSKQVNESLDRVLTAFPDLRDRTASPAGSLSGGQQQMVAIGRALMGKPSLLVLDEPSLGLAPKMCERIFGVIADLHREEGLSVLLVEQNAKLSLLMSQRAYVLERGRVALSGDSMELANDLAVQHAYLGGSDEKAPNEDSPVTDLEAQIAHVRNVLNWDARNRTEETAAL